MTNGNSIRIAQHYTLNTWKIAVLMENDFATLDVNHSFS